MGPAGSAFDFGLPVAAGPPVIKTHHNLSVKYWRRPAQPPRAAHSAMNCRVPKSHDNEQRRVLLTKL